MSLQQRIGDRETKYVLEVLQGQFRKSDSAAGTRLEKVLALFRRGARPAPGRGLARRHSVL